MDVKIINTDNDLWLKVLSSLQHDIYHLPGYIALEAKRYNAIPKAILITDERKIFFLPYLLRQFNDLSLQGNEVGPILDIISPYGYPGILLSKDAYSSPEFVNLAIEKLKISIFEQGACSAFFRLHPILNNFVSDSQPESFVENGTTVSVDLKLSEEEIWSHTRKGHKSTINKCKRLGMQARMVPVLEYLEVLSNIQEETNERVGASQSYYDFNYDYFLNMFNSFGEKLHICIVELDDRILCAGLYSECCGIVQSIFGGTKNNYINLSPSTLETDYARYWAKKRGNSYLHLGGGVGGRKDSVYTFKSGFSKQKHSFVTLRLISDQPVYDRLVRLRAKSIGIETDKLLRLNFFPAYRYCYQPNLGS